MCGELRRMIHGTRKTLVQFVLTQSGVTIVVSAISLFVSSHGHPERGLTAGNHRGTTSRRSNDHLATVAVRLPAPCACRLALRPEGDVCGGEVAPVPVRPAVPSSENKNGQTKLDSYSMEGGCEERKGYSNMVDHIIV